jgi:hypothetical protein
MQRLATPRFLASGETSFFFFGGVIVVVAVIAGALAGGRGSGIAAAAPAIGVAVRSSPVLWRRRSSRWLLFT